MTKNRFKLQLAVLTAALVTGAVTAAASPVIVPPLPLSAPTVTLWPFRSSVPPLTVRLPVLAPKAAEFPNCSVPAAIVVPPL